MDKLSTDCPAGGSSRSKFCVVLGKFVLCRFLPSVRASARQKLLIFGRTLGRLAVLQGTLRALLMHPCNHA